MAPSAHAATEPYAKVAFIGFGEAGPVFARALLEAGVGRIAAYDILSDDPASAGRQRAKCAALGIEDASGPAEAVTEAGLVISTVTADQTVAAARRAAPHLRAGQVYLDLNSTSPADKRRAAEAVEGNGAAFVEGVAMDTVPNCGAAVPLLVSGCAAEPVAEALNALGLRVECLGGALGMASSAKMLRSVLVKGLAALCGESMLAASKLGLQHRVLASMAETFPGLDWEEVAGYYLGRSAVHATRQAAEMRAAADTLRDLGVEPLLTEATAARLQWASELGVAARYRAGDPPSVDDYVAAVAAARGGTD